MVRFCVRGVGVGPLAGVASGATQVADPPASWGRFTWRSPGRSQNGLSAVFDLGEVPLCHAAASALDCPGQPVKLGLQVPKVP